jgi:hypothetical protein
MLIEDAEKATKLARAIMSDITLYNGDKIARAADPKTDLASEIDEGRSLFRSRVAPAHHRVFEDAVAAWSPPRARPKIEPPGQHADLATPGERAEKPPASNAPVVAAFLVVLLVVGALVFFFALHANSHHEPEPAKHEGRR